MLFHNFGKTPPTIAGFETQKSSLMRIVEQKDNFANCYFSSLFQPSDALSPRRFSWFFIAPFFISRKENTRKFQNFWKQKFDQSDNFAIRKTRWPKNRTEKNLFDQKLANQFL